jgi:uncharacterized protein
MRILISGSTGLIGTALAHALADRGDEVVRLVRPTTDAPAAGTVAWDPARGHLDVASLERLGPLDAVVHLAGAGIADKRWSAARKDEILESRTRSTALLAGALGALSHRPAAFVSGSAIGFYGSRGDEVLDEGSAAGSGFLAEVCIAWEAAAQAAADAGIRTVLARTGIVLSRHGGAMGRQLPLFRLGLGGRLGSGRQWISWITLADEVAGLLACAQDASLHGPVNLTAPNPVTNREFTAALGAALHRPTALPVPPLALKAALGSELVDEALLASQRVLPRALEASGFSFSAPRIDGALAGLLA